MVGVVGSVAVQCCLSILGIDMVYLPALYVCCLLGQERETLFSQLCDKVSLSFSLCANVHISRDYVGFFFVFQFLDATLFSEESLDIGF